MTIHEKTGYDALSSSPIDFAGKLNIPAMFMAAEKDTISPPEKVKKMFDKYGSDKKKYHVMQGREHADARLDEDHITASKYLKHLYAVHRVSEKERHQQTLF